MVEGKGYKEQYEYLTNLIVSKSINFDAIPETYQPLITSCLHVDSSKRIRSLEIFISKKHQLKNEDTVIESLPKSFLRIYVKQVFAIIGFCGLIGGTSWIILEYNFSIDEIWKTFFLNEKTTDHKETKPKIGSDKKKDGRNSPADIEAEQGKIDSIISLKKIERDSVTSVEKLPSPVIDLASDMMEIPAGTFTPGCNNETCSLNERYFGNVVNIDSFLLGKYEVTEGLWQSIMKELPLKSKGYLKPVTHITYEDIQQFIERLNLLTGETYRLPTEFEWEYASDYSSYDQWMLKLDSTAWFGDNSYVQVHEVGTKDSTEYGLHDMTGNVMEWTSSEYALYSGTDRLEDNYVVRGGSFASGLYNSRPTKRKAMHKNDGNRFIGFRLAKN